MRPTVRSFPALLSAALVAGALVGAQAPATSAQERPRLSGLAPVEDAGPVRVTAPTTGSRWSALPAQVAVMPSASVVGGDRPWLSIPGMTELAAADVRVMDPSRGTAQEIQMWSGSIARGWTQIGAVLPAGRTYRVDVRATATEAWTEAGTIAVIGRRQFATPTVSLGGMSVSTVTGDVDWSWQGADLPGPSGGAGVGLTWRSGGAQEPGLPIGWQLDVRSGSPWSGLTTSSRTQAVVQAPAHVTIEARVAPGGASPRVDAVTYPVAVSVKFPERADIVAESYPVRELLPDGTWHDLGMVTRRQAVRETAAIMKADVGVRTFQVGAATDGTVVWGKVLRIGRTGAAAQPVGAAPAPAAVDSAPRTVTVSKWDGSAITFQRNGLGVYEQLTGGSRAPGYENSLNRAADGSWQLTDPTGVTTRFVAGRAVSVQSNGTPVTAITWDGQGRVTSVANEIGRTVSLTYADPGAACNSASWAKFTAPPAGMLCAISYPWGDRVDLGYDGEQIGLVKEPGNQGVGLGWDAWGRLVAERSALVTSVLAAVPGTYDALARVSYDPAGRAATLTDAAPSASVAPAVRSITFPRVTSDIAKKWLDAPGKANAVQALVAYTAPAGAALSKRTWLDPVGWSPLESRDAQGLETTIANEAKARVLTSGQRRSMRTTYDVLGRPKTSQGPFVKGGVPTKAAETSTSYDVDVKNGVSTPWSGLRAQVFADANYGGRPRSEFWRAVSNRGGVSYAWTGTKAGWSAVASAVWTPSDAADKAGSKDGWRFVVSDEGAGALRIVIAGIPCVPDQNRECVINGLPLGPKPIEVTIPRASAGGYFGLSAGAGTAKPDVIPAAQASPGYSLAARVESNDTTSSAARKPVQVSEFADPASGEASASVSPGNRRTVFTYEATDPARDLWGRPLTRRTPGGRTVTTSYWATTGTAALPAPCGAGTVSLSGQPRKITRQDGTSIEHYYDDRGLDVAVVQRDDAGVVTSTTCLTLDADGIASVVATYAGDGSLAERTTTERHVDGNPLVRRVTIEHGSAAPVSPGAQVVSTATTDLLGREVSSESSTGVSTQTAYDSLSQVVSSSSTAVTGQRVTSEYTYGPGARLADVVMNGVKAASITYDAATGQIASVTYAGGTVSTFTYGPDGRVSRIAARSGAQTYTQTATATDFGRTVAVALEATGPIAFTEGRSYRYDTEGRLTSASISSTMPGAHPTTDFAYSYGAQAARCGVGYPQAGDDNLRVGGSRNGIPYTTCYDDKGRPVSTTDPLVTGDPSGGSATSLAHDSSGRLTSISGAGAPLSLSWGTGGDLAGFTDGSDDSVAVTLDTFGGALVTKSVASAAGTSTVRYAGPFLLAMSDDTVAGLAATQYGLPGGAMVTIAAGSDAVLSVPGIDGAALFTVAVPGLADGSSVDVGPAPRYGPYGEPLDAAALSPASAIPSYRWREAMAQETLPGGAGITLMGSRAYLPALGQFLSPDPDPSSGSNVYGYTDGDPINTSDPSGNETESLWAAGAGSLVGVVLAGIFGRYVPGAWGAALGVLSAAGAGVGAMFAAQLAQGDQSDSTMTIIASVGAAAVGMLSFGVGRWRLVKAAPSNLQALARRGMTNARQGILEAKDAWAKMPVEQRLADAGYVARQTFKRNQRLLDPSTLVRNKETVHLASAQDRSLGGIWRMQTKEFVPGRGGPVKVTGTRDKGFLIPISEDVSDSFISLSEVSNSVGRGSM